MSSAPPLSTPLALARVAHVAEALLACVDSTFGVAGKDRWIRNARNQVVITNSGDAVLRAVTVTHPVASYLREVITTHAERHGDGSVSTLAMVTAGVARVAELCGGDFDGNDSRRKRASLANALSFLADGALRTTLLPLAIDAATVRVPVPGLERLESLGDARCEDDTRKRETETQWDPGDRFRAGLRAAAATSLAGASAPATRLALTKIAVTLVANTVERALFHGISTRDRPGDDGDAARDVTDGDATADFAVMSRKSKIESLRVALRNLRETPPVWSARGACVEQSALLRGVLLRGRLVRVAEARNAGVSHGVDAPARVAALRGVALDDPFFGNEDDYSRGFECTYAYGSDDTADEIFADETTPETAELEVLRSARFFAARTRADVLASRGVDLVVSTTRVSALVASALADRGVFVVELCSSSDFDTLLSSLRIAPVSSPTLQALRLCDVGAAVGGFREKSAGPGLDVFTHVFTDASFAALVRGFGAETAELNAFLLRRAVRVLTRAFVVTETHASLCLVPGGGACEAALCAAASDADGTFRGREGKTSDDSSVVIRDGEGDAAALDVLRAMARAVPDALAFTGRDETCSRRAAADVLAAAANAHEALESDSSLENSSLFGDDCSGARRSRQSRREQKIVCRRALVGLVSAASAPETAHPGTAAAILDEAPPNFRDAFFSSDESLCVSRAYAHATADPVLFGVLEPAETKKEALVLAVEAVAQTTRIEQIVRARLMRENRTPLFKRVSKRVSHRKKHESDESRGEDDSEVEAMESSDASESG